MEIVESKKINQGLKSQNTEDEKDYSNQRLANGLSLRKRRINAIISKRRGIEGFKIQSKEDYEINLEKLEIPKEIKYKKYDDIDNFLSEMKKYILSDNIEYNKLALYSIRKQTTSNESLNNKTILSNLLVKQDFISDILNLIQNNIDNKHIINEGLWILINTIFFQKDNSDLTIFLSNSHCIQLYKKILEKKDNYLRSNVYWILADLLSNDDPNLNQQVIFHIYMSPLFRLHIFKDLEDNNSKLTEIELENLLNILSHLSEFLNKAIIKLINKDIKIFVDYNSEVEYDSIKENNDFLFYHTMKILIDNIENQKLTPYCLCGLSILTNFLDDSVAYDKFFMTGIYRKLIKNQIKVEEKDLVYAIRIIGNYINYTPEKFLDPIILEETIIYCKRILETYPKIESIKKDVYWCLSNISSSENNFAESLAKNGLISLALESLCTDSDKVVNEILFMLAGFFDSSNIDAVINYHDLDYIKYLFLCLQRIHNECKFETSSCWIQIMKKLVYIIGFLFETANMLKNEDCSNKFIFDFEKKGGFELVESLISEHKFPIDIEKGLETLLNMRQDN